MQDTPFRGSTAAALLAIALSLSLPVQAKSLPPGEGPADIVPVADPGASTVPPAYLTPRIYTVPAASAEVLPVMPAPPQRSRISTAAHTLESALRVISALGLISKALKSF